MEEYRRRLGERILLKLPRPIEWLAQPGAEARGQSTCHQSAFPLRTSRSCAASMSVAGWRGSRALSMR